MQLSEEQLNKILNNNLGEKYWVLELGIGYVYENDTSGARYKYPYDKIGAKFWSLLKGDVYNLICEDGDPKEWVNDLITGDIRNLIVGVVSAITAKYEVTLGISIPIAALIVKSGVIRYCKEEEHVVPSKDDVKEIIAKKTLLKLRAKNQEVKRKKIKTKTSQKS